VEIGGRIFKSLNEFCSGHVCIIPRVPTRWGMGDKSPPQMIQGGISPLNFSFFGKKCSGFENLITLSVILRHLEAELIIPRCLKFIRGLFPLSKKLLFFFYPLKLISGGNREYPRTSIRKEIMKTKHLFFKDYR
jgi:hypothetical protein